MLSEAILKIENQIRDTSKNSLEYAIANVLMHLCREMPSLASAVAGSDKTIKDCFKHMRDYAQKHQSGGCGVIDADVGTKLYCEFYGAKVPDTSTPAAAPATAPPATGKVVDILDFLE